MKSNRLAVFALAAIALLWASPAYGQSDRGTLTGTVTDPTGAVVPNAKITATNLSNGEVREATSTDSGSYTIPELGADSYSLNVEAQGFKTSTVDDLKIAVQVTRRQDITLEVGVANETVVVSSDDTTVIQADSAVRQSSISERQVRELPLAVNSEAGGRSPLSFIFLDSNVSAAGGTSGGGSNATNFRVSGGQGLGTEILIDGAATRRQQNGTFFSEVSPGPNAFQEFTLSTSTYSAEFGNSSGGIVNFSLKSGGNEFHGEVYNLVRNEKLNANSFTNNANGLERNRDNQNNFGFNIGGPIYLPRFGEGGPALISGKNRLFFFYNYEGYRFTLGENNILTVPTLRMRQGDFGELLTDPQILAFFRGDAARGIAPGVRIYNPRQDNATRDALPGNIIPTSLIDPAGLAILQAFPLPNRPGVARNYLSNAITPQSSNQSTGKIDFVASEKHRISGSYTFRRNARLVGSPRFPLPFTSQGVFNQNFKTYLFRLQDDYTFTPTLLNHFNLGITRYDVANANTTVGFNTSSLGIPVGATQNAAFPRVGFPNYGDPRFSGDPRAYQDIGSSFFTDRQRDNTIQPSDFLTLVTGRQTMKFGADFRISQFNVRQIIDPGGTFNFRNEQTSSGATVPDPTPNDPNRRRLVDPDSGYPIASLITGATEFAFNSTNSIDPAFRQFQQSYFFQDDIKLMPQLTLNLGVRYDLPGLRYEKLDRFRTFDPTQRNPAIGRLGVIAGAANQGGVQARFDTLAEPDRSNIGPRVGFAYSFDSRTVIRGGAGIYYAPILYGTNGGGDINTGTIGYNTTGQEFRPERGNERNAANFLSTFPARPEVDPNGQFLGRDVQYFDPDFKTGRTVQYSLDIQRQIPFNLLASIGYIGSKATRLRSDFARLNALSPDALRLGAAFLNSSLADILNNPNNANARAYARDIGVNLPASTNAVFPGFNGTVAQSLRAFPQYNNINNLLESQGTADYNALQLKLDRRFAAGFQFGASYTFSKLLTDASEDVLGQNPLGGILQIAGDRNGLRSVSPNNPSNVFVVNYLFELPFGQGRRFLNRGGFIDKLVGGFQFGGIQRYQSGLPLIFLTDNSDARGFLDLVGVRGNLRLNLTGQPILIGDRGSSPQPQFEGSGSGVVIINRAAFAAPTPFGTRDSLFTEAQIGSAEYRAYYADPSRFFGNTGVLPNIKSNAFLDENVSLLKKTRLTETVTLELGAEAFNIFNRKRFFAPTTNFNADSRIFGFQSVQDFNNRIIQLRGRVIF